MPDTTIRAGIAARAVVEIVIDRKGHPQASAVISSTQEDFGWAAATAAGRWQFAPPTRGGEPVDVRVRIPF